MQQSCKSFLLQIRNDGEILWAFDSATCIKLEAPLLRFEPCPRKFWPPLQAGHDRFQEKFQERVRALEEMGLSAPTTPLWSEEMVNVFKEESQQGAQLSWQQQKSTTIGDRAPDFAEDNQLCSLQSSLHWTLPQASWRSKAAWRRRHGSHRLSQGASGANGTTCQPAHAFYMFSS